MQGLAPMRIKFISSWLQMTSEIVVGLLTLIGTIITVWSGNKLTAYRIEQLEKKVNKHNNLIERTFKIEERIAIDEQKIEILEGYHERH